ncbi:hypothetical protein DFS34DRAFT_630778 [Phlyctochytrium arcticum]|nr:hypothetical protein DFS34DRAFT_630778 [Phlyctochytrium arcticum]
MSKTRRVSTEFRQRRSERVFQHTEFVVGKMDNIFAGLETELNDFESYVDNYTSKMDDILSGRVTDTAFIESTVNSLRDAKLEEHPSKAEAADDARRIPKKGGLDYSRWEKIAVEDETNEASQGKDSAKAAPAAENHKASDPDKTPSSPRTQRTLERVSTHRLNGNAFFKTRDYPAAIKEYTLAIEAYTAKEVREEKSGTRAGETTEKIEKLYALLDRVVPKKDTLKPDASLYTNRALAHLRMQSFEQAIADCTTALELDANNVKAFWRRAEAFRACKKYQDAEADLKKLEDLIGAYETRVEGLSNRGGRTRRQVEKENLAGPAPGLTLKEVLTYVAEMRREEVALRAEESLRGDLNKDGSHDVMSGVLDGFVREAKALSEGVATQAQKETTQAAATLLTRLLSADNKLDVSSAGFKDEYNVADAFRVCSGFERLILDDSVFSAVTANLILPVLFKAVSASSLNASHLRSSHISRVVQVMLGCRQPHVTTVESAAGLLCSTAGAEVSKTQDRGVWAVWNGVKALDSQAGRKLGEFLLAFLESSLTVSGQDAVTTTPATRLYLLKLLTTFLGLPIPEQKIVFKDWGLEPSSLIKSVISALTSVDRVESEGAAHLDMAERVPAVASCLWLDASVQSIATGGALEADSPGMLIADVLVEHHEDIVSAIWTSISTLTARSRDSTSSTAGMLSTTTHLLATYHNLLPILPPHPELLTTYSIPTTLVSYLTSTEKSNSSKDSLLVTHSALATFARLLPTHKEILLPVLDGWWDALPILSFLLPTDLPNLQLNMRTHALPLLLAFLELDQGRTDKEWVEGGGLEVLVRILEDLEGQLGRSKKDGTGEATDGKWKDVGNTALCLAHCLTKRNGHMKHACLFSRSNVGFLLGANAESCHSLGATPLLINLLRATSSLPPKAMRALDSVQRNLAIACARLCSNCRKSSTSVIISSCSPDMPLLLQRLPWTKSVN